MQKLWYWHFWAPWSPFGRCWRRKSS